MMMIKNAPAVEIYANLNGRSRFVPDTHVPSRLGFASQHKRAARTPKIKESDPTSMDENVDLALLNRLVRSLPRNSHPAPPPNPPNPERTNRQTHTQTDAEPGNSPRAAITKPAAPTNTQDKENDIPFQGK